MNYLHQQSRKAAADTWRNPGKLRRARRQFKIAKWSLTFGALGTLALLVWGWATGK